MNSFSYLEPVCCSMSSSNCCFLICIHISQEADQVVWYSHLFQNFPQFLMIHTVKGFGIVNKAEIDPPTILYCWFYYYSSLINEETESLTLTFKQRLRTKASQGVSGEEPTDQCRRHRRLGFHPWVGKMP